MLDPIWPESNGGNKPLLRRMCRGQGRDTTDSYRRKRSRESSSTDLHRLGHPPVVEDVAWSGLRQADRRGGSQQFLVNLLHVLRECFQEESTA